MLKVRLSRAGALWLCALVGVIAAMAFVEPGAAAVFAPFFALIALYLAGRFPGEELLERLLERYVARAPRRHSDRRPIPRAPFVRRVGRAVAFALAVRPPPAPFLAS